MGRIVYAEEKLLPDIIKFAKTDGFIPGLILGQNSGQKDYVIHLARTPLPSEKEKENIGDADGEDLNNSEKRKSVQKLTDIQDTWLADHSKQVTRMLPGGMWVLGIFIVGPGDIFADSSCHNKLNSILFNINKHLASNPYLCGNGPCSEKLIFHLSSTTQKLQSWIIKPIHERIVHLPTNSSPYTCKSFDISSAGNSYRPVEWKFQGNNKWHQLECQYDFEQFATYQVTEKRANLPLRKQLKEILHSVNDSVLKATCTIDGEIKEGSSSLEVSDKNKKSQSCNEKSPHENKVLQVNLYVTCESEDLPEDELKVVDLIGEMKCTGVLSSIVFLNQKAQVVEAVKAVKEDIIRSWAARLEMHWDSLVEEEVGTPEETMVVHEPPRRALIPLPHSKVALSDYLFPGEGPSEALISLQELLGVKVNESLVQKDFEGQPDIQNITSGNEPSKTDMIVSTTSGNSSSIITGILFAFIVLIASFIIRLYMNSRSD